MVHLLAKTPFFSSDAIGSCANGKVMPGTGMIGKSLFSVWVRSTRFAADSFIGVGSCTLVSCEAPRRGEGPACARASRWAAPIEIPIAAAAPSFTSSRREISFTTRSITDEPHIAQILLAFGCEKSSVLVYVAALPPSMTYEKVRRHDRARRRQDRRLSGDADHRCHRRQMETAHPVA